MFCTRLFGHYVFRARGESGHPDSFAGTLLAVAKAKLRVLRLSLPRRVMITRVVKTQPAPWIASADAPVRPQVDGGLSLHDFLSEIRSTLHRRWVERFKTHSALTYGEDSRDHLSRLSPGTLWPEIAAVGSRPEQRVLAGLRFGHCPLQFWYYNYHGAAFQHCLCGHPREDVCHYLLHCPNWARQRRLMVRSVRQAVGDRIVITEHLLLWVSAVRVSANQQRAIVSAVAVFAKGTIADRWWIW